MFEFTSVRFKRVFLVGSVLPQEFDWRTNSIRNQVQQVRSDMANADVPVEFLCVAVLIRTLHPGRLSIHLVRVPSAASWIWARVIRTRHWVIF